jgi:hypothetical protein
MHTPCQGTQHILSSTGTLRALLYLLGLDLQKQMFHYFKSSLWARKAGAGEFCFGELGSVSSDTFLAEMPRLSGQQLRGTYNTAQRPCLIPQAGSQ